MYQPQLTTSNACQFVHIPLELHYLVAQHLDEDSIRSLRLTCKHLYEEYETSYNKYTYNKIQLTTRYKADQHKVNNKGKLIVGLQALAKLSPDIKKTLVKELNVFPHIIQTMGFQDPNLRLYRASFDFEEASVSARCDKLNEMVLSALDECESLEVLRYALLSNKHGRMLSL